MPVRRGVGARPPHRHPGGSALAAGRGRAARTCRTRLAAPPSPGDRAAGVRVRAASRVGGGTGVSVVRGAGGLRRLWRASARGGRSGHLRRLRSRGALPDLRWNVLRRAARRGGGCGGVGRTRGAGPGPADRRRRARAVARRGGDPGRWIGRRPRPRHGRPGPRGDPRRRSGRTPARARGSRAEPGHLDGGGRLGAAARSGDRAGVVSRRRDRAGARPREPGSVPRGGAEAAVTTPASRSARRSSASRGPRRSRRSSERSSPRRSWSPPRRAGRYACSPSTPGGFRRSGCGSASWQRKASSTASRPSRTCSASRGRPT